MGFFYIGYPEVNGFRILEFLFSDHVLLDLVENKPGKLDELESTTVNYLLLKD